MKRRDERKMSSTSEPSQCKVGAYLYLQKLPPRGGTTWRSESTPQLLECPVKGNKVYTYNYSSDYKTRLTSLELLPIIYRLELNDYFFLSHLLKTLPQTLISYTIFLSATILSLLGLLPHLSWHFLPPSQLCHSFLHQLPILWNALPVTDLNGPISYIKKLVTNYLITHFLLI